MTKTELRQFELLGFKKLSEADLFHMDIQHDKHNMGYKTHNYSSYQQPANLKNRDALQAKLSLEVTDSDAYTGRRFDIKHKRAGQLIEAYTPYWEKLQCISYASFTSSDPVKLREEQAEVMCNALIDDGRLPIEKIEVMSSEQLRMACTGLGL